MAKKKHPSDINQLAKSIVDEATGEAEQAQGLTKEQRSKIARVLGSLGGLKGGPARAAVLTPEQRSEIAKKAAKVRWAKKG